MADEHPKKASFDYLVVQENEERVERRGLEQRALGLFGALLIGVPVVGTVAKDADLRSAAGILGLLLVSAAFILVVAVSSRMALALGGDVTRERGLRRVRVALMHIFRAPAKKSTGVKAARTDVMDALSREDYDRAALWQRYVVEKLRKSNVALVVDVRLTTHRMPLVLILLLLGLGLLVSANEPAAKEEGGEGTCHDERHGHRVTVSRGATEPPSVCRRRRRRGPAVDDP